MRKLGLVIVSAVMSFAVCSTALADEAKVYYKDGTRIEFDNFDVKLNFLLQPRYSFVDSDAGDNTSEFDVRRSRIIASGNILEGDKLSYKIEYEFSDNGDEGESGELMDSWVQWNHEAAQVRIGNQLPGFSRQRRVLPQNLFFVERASVLDAFEQNRDFGVSAMTKLGPVNFTAGIFNGNSDVADTNHAFTAALDYSCGNYGSREVEGDFRDNSAMGITAGASLLYGESTVAGQDFDDLRLNADIGLRVAGLDLQGEYFYSELDQEGSTGSTPDANGFYVQAMYNMDKLGIGGRFGLGSPDETTGVDDVTEFSLVANYFLNGHYLKLQNQVTFLETSPVGNGEDVSDFRYDLQLAGFF